MKRYIFLLACAALAACTDRLVETEALQGGDKQSVTLRLTLSDDAATTRSNDYWHHDPERTNSAMGGLTNCELGDKYALRYQLEVWDLDGTHPVVNRQVVVDSYEDVVSYQLQLYPNHKYIVVAWADFIEKKADGRYHLDEPALDDLHYDTRDMRHITAIEHTDRINDESRDAYWLAREITVGQTTVLENFVLRRPFAKLRIVTTDWDKLHNEPIDQIQMEYTGCRRFAGMDALTGQLLDPTDDDSPTYIATLPATSPYKLNYDGEADNNRTILTDYLMADDTQQAVHFRLRGYRDGAPMVNGEQGREFTQDIPVQRNYLTTLLGDVLTTRLNLRAICFEPFARDDVFHYGTRSWNDVDTIQPQIRRMLLDKSTGFWYFAWHITKLEEWKWLFSERADKIFGWGFANDIILDADLDFNHITDIPVFVFNKKTRIHGHGHTIRNFAQDKPTHIYKIRPLPSYEGHVCVGMGVLFFHLESQVDSLTFENITLRLPQHFYDSEFDQLEWEWRARELYAAPIVEMNKGSVPWSPVHLKHVHAKHIVIYAPQGDDLGVDYRYWIRPKDNFKQRILIRANYYNEPERPVKEENVYAALVDEPDWNSDAWKTGMVALPGKDPVLSYYQSVGMMLSADSTEIIKIPKYTFGTGYRHDKCVRSWAIGGLIGQARGNTIDSCSVYDVHLYTNRNAGGLIGENEYNHVTNCSVDEVYIHTSKRVRRNLCKDIFLIQKNSPSQHGYDLRYWIPVTGALHWMAGINNCYVHSMYLLDNNTWIEKGKEPWRGNIFRNNKCGHFEIINPDGTPNTEYRQDPNYQPIMPERGEGGIWSAYHYDQGMPKENWGWTLNREGMLSPNNWPGRPRDDYPVGTGLWVDPETLVKWVE